MCPGLNALANHNYLPHNGFATIQQFIDGTTGVYGMGEDLAGFLAIYGALIDGDGLGWSIEGVPHTGIGGSHNNYEADSSPNRADLYQYGSNTKVVMEQFNHLYNMQPDASTANYNLEVLREYRGYRFQQSVSENPYFAYNAFAGIEVSQAAFTFIYRFMANKSAEYPEGILNKDVLKSFYSIKGNEGELYWQPGHEQIPNNWYGRNKVDAYTIPYFEADILYFAESQPEVLSIGCNAGKVNTFTGIDPAVLTNGAYTKESAAASPACFSTEYALAYAKSLSLTSTLLSSLTTAVTNGLSGMNCASISSLNQSAFNICPGMPSLYGGPTAAVAPGAIQNN
ncbi:hypothetical protein EJ03DRAFT_346179 [Teratosphaeria nubilosa]|uniref:Heme haloperoxidase family profile domain-containing protein n=1 Tax=Teratosphaeria nubilosa TaxID=161662 RepID=A0A6G1KVD9_9PEZI|nr:hypothetical protein EJ03DRAFT_346179 [Teratosphaeria nubilosa]